MAASIYIDILKCTPNRKKRKNGGDILEDEKPDFVFMRPGVINHEILREIVKKFIEQKRELFERYPDLNNSSFIAYMIFKPDSLSRMIRNIMDGIPEVHIK